MVAGRLMLVTSAPGLTEARISLTSLIMESSLSGGGIGVGRGSMRS